MRSILLVCLAMITTLTMVTGQSIVVDGNKADWADLPFLSEPGVFPYVKVLVEEDYVYYMLEVEDEALLHLDFGEDVYFESFLDADFYSATGQNHWITPNAGNDYQITNSMHFWDGSSMVWKWYPVALSGNAQVAEVGFEIAKLLTIPDQSEGAKIPLASNFGIGFKYWANDAEFYFPAINWDFPYRRSFSVKQRAEFELNATQEIILGASEAYYMPFMKDDNVGDYLDFQSGSFSTQNPLHWASWAIDLVDPAIYDVKFTSQCADGGKLQFFLVDMATNETVFTSDEIWYQVNAEDFSEQLLGQLDFSEMPVGKYMLKVKNNTTWGANLKVQDFTLVQEGVSTNWPDIALTESFIVSGSKGELRVDSSDIFSVSVFDINGVCVYASQNIRELKTQLPNGVYIVKLDYQGTIFSKKVVL